ncbi:dsba-like thioredoxin domain-containing protein [Thozetella sp. PMI_491]|nr:dsba-like thioredoxin domain-containing protein [Thozetella sp. PMI_491]
MAVINIDIVSDPVCIFCYIGKKRLDKAIELHKKVVAGGSQDKFNITWHPFSLDPNGPTTGIPTAELTAKRFGTDQVPRIQDRLRRMGECDGISFCIDNKIGNTRDAHRVLELARKKDVQHAVADALFNLYFEKSGDITSHEMLLQAGTAGGLDASECQAWLDGDDGGDVVDSAVEKAKKAGLRGVPQFTINGKFHIDGAQDVKTFLEEFAKARGDL